MDAKYVAEKQGDVFGKGGDALCLLIYMVSRKLTLQSFIVSKRALLVRRWVRYGEDT